MLSVDNVELTYNDVILAVKGISFKVPEGEIVALLGANGAGKSTVLKSISGVLKSQDGKIESGKITYKGKNLKGISAEKIVKMGICQVPEGRRTFFDLTCYENLRAGAFTRRDRRGVKDDIEQILTYFPPLVKRLNIRAGYLSGGEQQMLAIGRALMSRPQLLLLDEPSLGLAPLAVKDIFSIIKRINAQMSIAILLVEQNANMALQIAKHGYIMENGRIVMDDPCEKLLKNEDVMEFYLGITEEGGKKSFAEVKHYKRRKRWLS
ncbi:MAG TPA: ABC transporter ATP-binding protein [Desulfobacteraceae bacterium]|nr:ABC transporter ATP-binding protein [Desulfobacteraceae bacterium]HPJ67164.1 ABC transporter ATP-binding protein [Desulfobacteraceae bacterium]HPQ29330.1 ABC transporter ATP-binding protein [Desulfobacteraceae bacterium]